MWSCGWGMIGTRTHQLPWLEAWAVVELGSCLQTRVYHDTEVANKSQSDLGETSECECQRQSFDQSPSPVQASQPAPKAGSEPLPGRLQESFREGEASQ